MVVLSALDGRTAHYALVRMLAGGPLPAYEVADANGQHYRLTCIPDTLVTRDELQDELDRCQACAGDAVLGPLRVEDHPGFHGVLHPQIAAEDLAAVRVRQPLTAGDALSIIREAAHAVQRIHRGGLLHGSLDPRHVLIDADSQVLVQGLGLYPAIKQLLTSRQAMFSSNLTAENPFWAPELGIADAPQVDLFSLGRLLLFLLTGDWMTPVQWQAHAGRWDAGRAGHDLALSIETLPEAIRDVLRRTLATGVDDRFESCHELIDSLNAAGSAVAAVGDQMAISAAENAAVDAREHQWPAEPDLPAPDQPTAPIPHVAVPRTEVGPPRPKIRRHTSRAENVTVATRVAAVMLLPLLSLLTAWAVSLRQSPVFASNQYAGRALVATIPGRDGLWWLEDETTFFLLPPIRYHIIHDGPPGITSAAAEGPDALRTAVRELVLEDTGGTSALPVATADFAQWEMALRALAPQADAQQRFRHRLEACLAAYPAKDDAAQMHLRALLLHRLSAVGAVPSGTDPSTSAVAPPSYADLAEQAYRDALRLYAWHDPALAALCCADLARLLATRGKTEAADAELLRAEALVRSASPAPRRGGNGSWADDAWKPFLVSVYDQMVALYRKDGGWSKAENVLAQAAELVGLNASRCSRQDGNPRSASTACHCPRCKVQGPLQAFVLEREAWYLMDRWQIVEAMQNFLAAAEFRKGRQGSRSRELYYHNRHGWAMAQRYAGRAAEASAEYQKIVANIEDDLKGGLPRSQAERALLESRLLNSRERLADCVLYGLQDWSLAEARLNDALDDAEQGIQLSDPQDELVARLFFKKALAAALDGRLDDSRQYFQQADELVVRSSAESSAVPLAVGPVSPREPSAWSALFSWWGGTARPEVTQPPPAPLSNAVLQYIRNVIQTAIASRSGQLTAEEAYSTLRREFIQLDRQNKVSRDELDLIMLVARQLPDTNLTAAKAAQNPPAAAVEPLTASRVTTLCHLAQFNVALARLPQREGQNRSILSYVAGSYSHAKRLFCAAGRPQCERIEAEATWGWAVNASTSDRAERPEEEL